jgi:sulfite reductase (NADPH) hemoprotein beta-component
MTRPNTSAMDLDPVERIKADSGGLRGKLADGLQDEVTGAIQPEDNALLKFHGVYQQDDRDMRKARQERKLEPAYQFMVRLRMPGGICSPAQWLALDELARRHANASLRTTTRQTIQLHGVLKRNLRRTIQGINEALFTTLATCGDVNRNVICHPHPNLPHVHTAVHRIAERLSAELLPHTRAYHELWLDNERITPVPEPEPLYGATYLPRKFKIAIAIPPSNDVDVFAHCLGFIAIAENDRLVAFNISIGGGMGMTHGDPDTFPRLGQVIGACAPDQAFAVAEQVVAIQRDFGNRTNRRRARFKYTIEDRGLTWFVGELESRLGWSLGEAAPYAFAGRGDAMGWAPGEGGRQHLTIRVPSGRIADSGERQLLTGFREIARIHTGDFRITPNQNVIIANIEREHARAIDDLAAAHGLVANQRDTALRRHALSCVSFPTCGLAMAESERVLPRLLDRLDTVLQGAGLTEQSIDLRVTGCPNGCARPYLGEIALVGKGPDNYKMFLGGSPSGDRLASFYQDNVSLERAVTVLEPLLHQYAATRLDAEAFGDWTLRHGHASGEPPRGA